jgi:dephospho-CoA kinase
MYQVGITGGIGSGKTLVCSVLSKLGVPVYDADGEARRLMNKLPVLMQGIEELLGKEAYREGRLDRKYVGSRVFGNHELLTRLNGLVHPAVRENYRSWVNQWRDAPYVVEEAAILFESGAYRFLDRTVLVFAPSDLRITRVMHRDGIGREEVKKRMMHQMDEEEKRVLADEVVVNDEKNMLLPQIIALHNKIVNR